MESHHLFFKPASLCHSLVRQNQLHLFSRNLLLLLPLKVVFVIAEAKHAVQVCDATMLHEKTIAGTKKISTFVALYIFTNLDTRKLYN
jgi:hypothetical protein